MHSCRHMLRRRAFLFLLLAVVPAGCGVSDLYDPPRAPFHVVGRVALPSANEGVAVLEDHAFVAGGEAGLHVVDISDPAAPVLRQTLDTTKYAESVEVVRTFVGHVLQDEALVVEGTEGVTTYDITDPEHVVPFHQGTTAVDGNRLFVEEPDDPELPFTVFLAESWKGVRLFTSDPLQPGVLVYDGVFTGTRGYAKGISVRDSFAYVADDEMGLAVIDARVRLLGEMQVVSWADTPGNALDVVTTEGYAFVADGTEGLAVFRIHRGDTPVKLAQLDLSGYSRAIAVQRGYAFLAAADAGIHVVDVSDPADPQYLGAVESGYASDVTVTPGGLVLVADREDGLLVLAGPDLAEDRGAPARVTSLAAEGISSTAVRLTWYATGDDGLVGRATACHIRYAAAPITDEAAWAAATPVDDAPAPAAQGEAQEHTVTGLAMGTTYHFCLRLEDDAGRLGPLSNDAAATTTTGTLLLSPGFAPAYGTVDQEFTFSVVYQDAEGDPAVTAELLLDGAPLPMTAGAGDPRDGVTYTLATTLAAGAHTVGFHFSDGQGGEVTLSLDDGPLVGVAVLMCGSPADETGRQADETLHPVVLTRDVIAAPHEVTQAEWTALMDNNPSRFSGDDRPVESITWYEAVAYCNRLSERDGLTPAYTVDGPYVTWNRDADGWRLPTEAEWEYLCRAGAATALCNGALAEEQCGLDANLDAVGWYCGNAPDGTRAVAQKQPNAWGLYDMHGNVREWCWDWYGPYPEQPVLDPAGPPAGFRRVIRGGSWHYFARECRSAARGAFYPDSADDFVGLRPVRYAD